MTLADASDRSAPRSGLKIDIEAEVKTMIDLPEGLYEVDQAYLVDANRRTLALQAATFEIWLDRSGRKRLRGRSFVDNLAFAELLNEVEEVDIVLSFFGDYFLWLQEPVIQVGKVFELGTRGSLLFSIGASSSFISREEFLQFIGHSR